MNPVKKTSFLLMLVLLAGAVWLRLGPVILAGLFSYMTLDLSFRLFSRRAGERLSRWLALLVFLLAIVAVSVMLLRFIHQALATLPQIVAEAVPRFVALAERYGVDLPFDNASDLKDLILKAVRENAEFITKAGGFLTKGFFHVALAIFVAVFAFFKPVRERKEINLYEVLCRELRARLAAFFLSFEKVFGAQLAIAGVNTALTSVFLLAMGFPDIHFLVLATFLLGTLPIIGNLLSNAVILATALTISPSHAGYALVFLVLIHKGEYFLNSRIIGSQIDAPMWQTLLAILLGERIFGVPGILLAPTVMHYVKQELRALK
jgi:predicted PurR-regulated permease PerM